MTEILSTSVNLLIAFFAGMVICAIARYSYDKKKRKIMGSRRIGKAILYNKNGVPNIGVLVGIYEINYNGQSLGLIDSDRVSGETNVVYEVYPGYKKIDRYAAYANPEKLVYCDSNVELITNDDHMLDVLMYIKRSKKNKELLDKHKNFPGRSHVLEDAEGNETHTKQNGES